MKKIKISEDPFFSFQGEGKYVGVPSVFMRVFGCNFRCKNFGRHGEDILSNDVKVNPEVAEVIKNIAQYKSITELPLVNTGCDSYLAVYPEFKNLCPTYTTDELANMLLELTPNKQWTNDSNPSSNPVHLVITGGEPLLGWQKAYTELFDEEAMASLSHITFETNGTQLLSVDFQIALKVWASEWEYMRDITFSVSPKLSASGEPWSKAICPSVVASYQEFGDVYLKFVVDCPEHFVEVDAAVAEYRAAGFTGNVYVMAVGGTSEMHSKNEFNVATYALARGYYYSPRLHIALFGNSWAT